MRVMTPDGTRRLPVNEAALALGISTEATRQRIKRGTLSTERDKDGNVFVLLDGTDDGTRGDGVGTSDSTSNGTPDGTPDGTALIAAKDETINVLREQLQEEREANRENRRIIAGLVQRVPELEAAPEPRSWPSEESFGNGVPEDQEQPQERRSWWRRFFGLV